MCYQYINWNSHENKRKSKREMFIEQRGAIVVPMFTTRFAFVRRFELAGCS
jgi:hypothetical protein